MKKNILFVIPEYSHGGTNKSLENLLTFFDHTNYEVKIFCLYEDGGVYYKNLFKPFIIQKSKLYTLTHDHVVTRKVFGLWRRINKKANFEWLYKKEVQRIQDEYQFDAVIAYQEGTATRFVNFFQNTKKIAWVHYEYGASFWGKKHREFNIYNGFDKIVCVSESAAKSFVSVYPQLKEKTIGIYNTIDTENIQKKAEETIQDTRFTNDCFSIISIGRFASPKQFQLIPEIARKIKEHTQNDFKWFIIGPDGGYLLETQQNIIQQGVENSVILLGEKDNPYPYIKQSQLLVCTSATESFSYVIAEAKILHTPVVSNNFPVAHEVLDERCGFIANIKKMDVAIQSLIENHDDTYSRIKNSIQSYQYENETIMNKIYSIL